jgi:hypothetical protein
MSSLTTEIYQWFAVSNLYTGGSMNKLCSMVVIVTAMSACIAFAQPKHEMPGMASEGVRDSMRPRHEMGMLEKEPGRMESCEKQFALHEGRCNEQMERSRNMFQSCPATGMMGRMPGHFCMFPIFCAIMFLSVMGIINILLTIIVSLDMVRNKRFNGLWVPVLLLAGIPGTALYALFRIGDNVKVKE